jgi:hypothetical protein
VRVLGAVSPARRAAVRPPGDAIGHAIDPPLAQAADEVHG